MQDHYKLLIKSTIQLIIKSNDKYHSPELRQVNNLLRSFAINCRLHVSYIVLALCERPICHNSISATGRLFSVAENRTPDPLNKSQIQSRPNRNIDKKAQPFSKTACLLLRQWKVYVLLRFRHKQAQSRTQDEKIGPQFAGSLCRY